MKVNERKESELSDMEKCELIDFSALEKELNRAVEADKKYHRENDAKFRAIHQKVATYEEFR